MRKRDTPLHSIRLSLFDRRLLALVSFLARRFDVATSEARAGIRLEPAHHPFYWILGWSLAALGERDQAVESLRQAATLGWALGLAGHRQEGLAILGELEKQRDQRYVSCTWIALAHIGLGDSERAFSWLHKAEAERDPSLSFLNTWPGFDPIRSDPRFQALLRRMNFPETPHHQRRL